MNRLNDKTVRKLAVVPEKHPVWAGADPDIVDAVIGRSVRREVDSGAILVEGGQDSPAVYLLESGSVRLYSVSAEGIEVTLEVLRAPAVFGAIDALLGMSDSNFAETLERASVIEIPRDVFLQAVASSHAICQNILRDVAAMHCVAAHKQRALALESVPARLAHVLLSYLDAYGLPVRDGIKIRLPINQHHLASVLGVSRRSVTRALKTWADEGTITRIGRYYVVRDTDRLSKAAGEDLLPVVYSSNLPMRAWVPERVVATQPLIPSREVALRA
jgi:CRP-like cAMP-binding protein